MAKPPVENNLITAVMEQNNKINEMAINHVKLSSKVDSIQDTNSRIETKLDKFIDAMESRIVETDKKIEAADEKAAKKYAPKLAWDIIRGIGVVAGSAAIIGAVKLVLFR